MTKGHQSTRGRRREVPTLWGLGGPLTAGFAMSRLEPVGLSCCGALEEVSVLCDALQRRDSHIAGGQAVLPRPHVQRGLLLAKQG